MQQGLDDWLYLPETLYAFTLIIVASAPVIFFRCLLPMPQQAGKPPPS
jgi:hypothetical protein